MVRIFVKYSMLLRYPSITERTQYFELILLKWHTVGSWFRYIFPQEFYQVRICLWFNFLYKLLWQQLPPKMFWVSPNLVFLSSPLLLLFYSFVQLSHSALVSTSQLFDVIYLFGQDSSTSFEVNSQSLSACRAIKTSLLCFKTNV